MWVSFDAGEGRTLSYLRRGFGPLVVCVPGGPGMDPAAYFSSLSLPGHELLVLAPRGTGQSTPPEQPEGYRIAGFAADVESLREHLGAERLTLYGTSHGGCVALAYAAWLPERVERFVLVNAPPRMDEAYAEWVKEVQARFAATFPDGARRLAASERAAPAMNRAETSEQERHRQYRIFMERYVARLGPDETAYLDRLCSAPMNFAAAGPMSEEFAQGLDLLAGAGSITAPALVIGAEFDVVVPAAAMRLVAERLADSRYVEFAGVGHFPDVEAVELFGTTVGAFLAG